MPRLLLLVLAGALALTVGALVHREPTRPTSAPMTAGPVHTRELRVLHAWDRRRARAWSHGSVRQLGRLYGPGCAAGAVDQAMLAAYRARGLRVTGMRRQTLAVQELEAAARVLTLRVTDRLAVAVAVGEGTRQPLPRQGFETQTLTFRRTPRGWVRVG